MADLTAAKRKCIRYFKLPHFPEIFRALPEELIPDFCSASSLLALDDLMDAHPHKLHQLLAKEVGLAAISNYEGYLKCYGPPTSSKEAYLALLCACKGAKMPDRMSLS